MVIDTITFNGEYDLLEIRLNILNDYVDQFIIVEFDKTFSGSTKTYYYELQQERYKKWHSKIKYYKSTEYNKYMELAQSSPNTVGAAHWKTEFCQKESIKDALTHLSDEDVCFIGDCDEVWHPSTLQHPNIKYKRYEGMVHKLGHHVYTYYLNNRSSEPWRGTMVASYALVKDGCLNHMRSDANAVKIVDPGQVLGGVEFKFGWHFTSQGGYDEVKRKLENSYTRESYWTPWVENNLAENVTNSKDFLGRGFIYVVDESEWPQYLKDNKEKYAHLCK